MSAAQHSRTIDYIGNGGEGELRQGHLPRDSGDRSDPRNYRTDCSARHAVA